MSKRLESKDLESKDLESKDLRGSLSTLVHKLPQRSFLRDRFYSMMI